MCSNNCFINMKLIKKQKVSDVTYVAPLLVLFGLALAVT